MKKIIIIGAGAMGSAFAVPCVDNKNDVSITQNANFNIFMTYSLKYYSTTIFEPLKPNLNTFSSISSAFSTS